MNRWRHRAVVALAATPLLVVSLVAASGSPWAQAWVVVAWLLGALVLDGVMWRNLGVHSFDAMRQLKVDRPEAVRTRVRELLDEGAACRVERDRMATLVEDLSSGLGEGLVLVDADLRIRLINDVARRFLGAGMVGRDSHLLEVLREPGVVDSFEQAAQGDHPQPVVVENPRGLWEVRTFPVRDGGAVGLLSDISVIRRASEFRRRFVQDLSHELRSPLAVLRTTVEAMEGDLESDLAEILVRQVERVDLLVAELNELASIEAGQLDLEFESVPLVEVVREVVQDHRPEATRAQVDLTVRLADELVCWCDRRGLYRVLSNLVDNAIKYNRPRGWVRIDGELRDNEVTIRVADSGLGIPASELQAVLQRFYRIDRARTPGRGGLGLGLAIVKHMVQYMGGTLALDSREEVGTTVTLNFPHSRPTAEG